MKFILTAAALAGLAWYFLAGPSSGGRCGILLDSLSAEAGFPGETIELRGSWGRSQGEKTPCLEGPENAALPVLSWSGDTVKVRLPETLPPGRYKLGVYCGAPKPGLVFQSGWRDFRVLKRRGGEGGGAEPTAGGPPAEEPPAAGEEDPAPTPELARPPAEPPPSAQPAPERKTYAAPRQGLPPNLRLWFWEHPKLRDAIVWETLGGRKEDYLMWGEDRKAALDRYFLLAWEGKPAGLADPPRNYLDRKDTETAAQGLSAQDALDLYLATVGHSLAVEAGRRVPWSMEEYAPAQAAALLSGPEMFYLSGTVYIVNTLRSGSVLPPPPEAAWAFMRGRVGLSRRETVEAVLEWLNANAIHFTGAATTANVEAQWQYRGLPPVTRILNGTPHTGKPYAGVKHRTAGCGGTTGFLRAVLRAVNIPVETLVRCGHRMPHFPADKLYLSHGDDPYGNWGKPYPCGVGALLLPEKTFKEWFDDPLTMDCANVGRGAREAAAKECAK